MTTAGQGKIVPFPPDPTAKPGLRFRVELLLVPDPIWRLLLVPEYYSFWDLHVAIQDAMGWQDKHLHQFTLDLPGPTGRQRFGVFKPRESLERHEVLPGWEYRVTDYFRVDLPPALYTYDFGDNWQHEVSLEGFGPVGDSLLLPTCLGGEGSCPPEDCGGPQGFAGLPGNARQTIFRPEGVVFENPRQRWERIFGHGG